MLHGLGSDAPDLADLPQQCVYASSRGIHRWNDGWAWLERTVDSDRPELLMASVRAVERWMDHLGNNADVVGAVDFSQGAILALQLMRRSPRRLGWVGQLSGGPFPADADGDSLLRELRPPVFWGHGTADPTLPPEAEEYVRTWLQTHSTLEEVRVPGLGHDVDDVVVTALAAFVDSRTVLGWKGSGPPDKSGFPRSAGETRRPPRTRHGVRRFAGEAARTSHGRVIRVEASTTSHTRTTVQASTTSGIHA